MIARIGGIAAPYVVLLVMFPILDHEEFDSFIADVAFTNFGARMPIFENLLLVYTTQVNVAFRAR